MSFRLYKWTWFFISLFTGLEYLALRFQSPFSVLRILELNGIKLFQSNFSTLAGRPISLTLGWTGFAVICTTNFYILRKRLGFAKNLGTMPGWLDFHIFCGLIGPTFIIFHTDFKVRGLVSISFWSMMVVAVSGIVGRYFYIQVVSKKSELAAQAEVLSKKLDLLMNSKVSSQATSQLNDAKNKFISLAGGSEGEQQSGIIKSLTSSFFGDLKLKWLSYKDHNLTAEGKALISQYAIVRRRIQYYEPFQRGLGYWHSFHLPFAVFMYLVAAIHIASALFFGVTTK